MIHKKLIEYRILPEVSLDFNNKMLDKKISKGSKIISGEVTLENTIHGSSIPIKKVEGNIMKSTINGPVKVIGKL